MLINIVGLTEEGAIQADMDAVPRVGEFILFEEGMPSQVVQVEHKLNTSPGVTVTVQ